MDIVISNNTGKPIYEQITTQVKAMIISGELKAGDAIPSMRALAKSIKKHGLQKFNGKQAKE